MYVTGQGSLRYRNATKSRTRVITALKAKDYALTAGDLDDRYRLPRIQSRVNALHGDEVVGVLLCALPKRRFDSSHLHNTN